MKRSQKGKKKEGAAKKSKTSKTPPPLPTLPREEQEEEVQVQEPGEQVQVQVEVHRDPEPEEQVQVQEPQAQAQAQLQEPEVQEEESLESFPSQPGTSQESKTKAKKGRRGPVPSFPWTTEQEEDLIDWWRQHECLYNEKNPDFHDRNMKRKLLENKAKEIGYGCDYDAINTRMSSLRTKLNHLMKPKASGSKGTKTPREQFVWDRLSFIRPYVVHRKTKSTRDFGKKSDSGSSSEAPAAGDSDAISLSSQDDHEDAKNVFDKNVGKVNPNLEPKNCW